MEIDPIMWITAGFECRNIPLDDPQQKSFFVKKPIAAVYKKKSQFNITWKRTFMDLINILKKIVSNGF